MQILNSANAIFVVTVLLLMQFDYFFHVAVPLHSALKLYIWKVLSSSSLFEGGGGGGDHEKWLRKYCKICKTKSFQNKKRPQFPFRCAHDDHIKTCTSMFYAHYAIQMFHICATNQITYHRSRRNYLRFAEQSKWDCGDITYKTEKEEEEVWERAVAADRGSFGESTHI